MFERLRVLYSSGRLTDAQLSRAVTLNWITKGQADEIVGVTT